MTNAHLSTLTSEYDVLLCDVWGVVHDGAAIYTEAVEALWRFRERGGAVILISNASRLGGMVKLDLDTLGVPPEAYDTLITSGDVTRDYIAARASCAVFDVGPGDARPIVEGLHVQFTSQDEADLAITSGAFGNSDSFEQLQPTLLEMRSSNLLLLCANPDAVTELGGRRVHCSGALAKAYARLGGRVIYAGKPQAPIYDRALALAAELRGASFRRERVLTIGDSLHTDLAGAVANDFASLFIWGGIHAGELGTSPTPAALKELFAQAALTPTAVAHRLVW